jgi:S1-C subfamily serine protease
MAARLLATTLALCLCALPTQATDWVPVVKDLERRVPRMQIAYPDGKREGSCSAVFINSEQGVLVTAAHCTGSEDDRPDITIAGRDAAIARSNRILDLAIIRVEPQDEDEACPLAKATPPRGTEVAVAGYAFGFQQMPMQFGRMSLPFLREDGQQLVNIDMIVGDSGGALIDSTGALVGLVSAVKAYGPMHLGVAVPVEAIRDYVKQYLPVEKKPVEKKKEITK